MKVDTEQVVFLSGVRTPFGSFGGSLKNHTATDLAVVASKAAIERAGVNPEDIDQTIIGNAQQTSADAIYLARHVGLRAGVPNSAPALTINRLCGSGFQSIVSGAEQILLGQADFVLAGGTENMSQAPFVARNVRWGVPFGREDKLSDSLWDGLYDPVADLKMAETAEKLGAQYNISREECDEFAYRSHAAYAAGLKAGNFDDEIVPVMIKKRREEIPFSTDEHPRLDIDKEAMVRLRPVFKKDGLVTAGNASGICDGGAAVVIARGATAAARGLKPIARLVAWGVAGCDPTTMGIGPVPATRRCLERAGWTIDDLDLVEANEAFAAQTLAVAKDLGWDGSKVNVNGGAIALGHPIGASGARILVTLLHEMQRRDVRRGLATLCIGGGQGVATAIER